MAYAVKEIFYTLQGEGFHAGTPAVFCRFAGCNLWSGREQDRAKADCTFCDTDFVGTDGTAGGKYESADQLAHAILEMWPALGASLPLAGVMRRHRAAKRRTEGGLANTIPVSTRPPLTRDGEGHLLGSTSLLHSQQPASGRGTSAALSHHRFVVLTGGEPLLQLDTPLIDALHQRGFTIAVESNGTLEAPTGIDWLCVSPKAANPLRQQSGHELKLVYPQDGVDPASFTHLNFQRFSLQPMDGPDRTGNTEKAIAYCLANPLWHLSLQTHKITGIR